MLSRRVFGIGACWFLLAGAGLVGCAGRPKALRYRLSIEVDSPEGLRTGSAVLETLFNPGSRFEYGASARTYGQAPFLDLGGGRYLFSVLSDPFGQRTMYETVLQVLRDPDTQPPLADPDASSFDQANETKASGTVRPKDYPMLVTFSDVEDPKTVAQVDPANLAASFGAGYALRRMTLDVVDMDEPLTSGFELRFKAIASADRPFRARTVGALRTSDPAGSLQSGYFVRRT